MMLGGHRPTPPPLPTGTPVRLPVARCDRQKPHSAHRYVANPRSGIDLHCPGLTGNRTIAQLLAEHPEYADLALYGPVRLQLGVAAA